MTEDYKIVRGPECRPFMDYDWWDKHALLIDDYEGYVKYGDSAYLIPSYYVDDNSSEVIVRINFNNPLNQAAATTGLAPEYSEWEFI